jgi:uncharacterized protein YdaU (DUF1376 family)
MASPQGIDHYMPFFGRDFYASTAAWTAEEVGHYIRLLVIQWDNGSLAADIQRLELVSPGVSKVWGLLEPKFPLWPDGQRRNRRMEEHRAKSAELKAKRSLSGRKGGAASLKSCLAAQLAQANAKKMPQQDGSKTEANGRAYGPAKTKPPSPTPDPTPDLDPSPSPESSPAPYSSSLRSEEFQQQQQQPRARKSTSAGSRRDDGWEPDAESEWEVLRRAWNATPGVERFEGLQFPRVDLLVARVSDPNWLRMYPEALRRLPSCRFFERPVHLRQFLAEHFVADVLCGTYDNPRPSGRVQPPTPVPRMGTL